MEALVKLRGTPGLKREEDVGGENWELCGLAVQEVYCGNEVKHVSESSLTLSVQNRYTLSSKANISLVTLWL